MILYISYFNMKYKSFSAIEIWPLKYSYINVELEKGINI